MTQDRQRRLGGSDPHQRWLVSFGDLLTLLLCFFISIVVFTPVESRSNSPTTQLTSDNFSEIEGRAPAPNDLADSGIRIAKITDGKLVHSTHFVEQDFQLGVAEFTPQGRNKFEKGLFLEGYQLNQVSLTVCNPPFGHKAEVSWFEATEKALYIRSQLIDSGVSTDGMAIRVTGPECSTVRNARSTESVALLRTGFKRGRNG